jgi:hypothetical protein
MKRYLMTICIATTLAACASQEAKEVKRAEAAPVTCATAEGDIRMLRSEKASVAQQIAAGVTSIVPIGFVIGVATQTEGQSFNMAIGTYNHLLDQKIAEIQRKCGVE